MKKFVPSALLFTIFLAVAVPARAQNGGSSVRLTPIATGLVSPVALTEIPDGSGRLLIVDQIGLIRVWTPDGGLLAEPFLDLRSSMVELAPQYDERGLLGLALHPEYAANGRFYVFYNAPLRSGAPPDWDDTATISEFTVSSTNPNVANTAESVLLEIDKPQSNHNGGALAFGPDGFLYISIGDGGGANDVGPGHVEDWFGDNAGGNGQDVDENLLGSILRIDVNADGPGGVPYAIPGDNPFADGPGMDEIWAFGFRNPYRMAFDGDRLFVGDAGQGMWEEVSIAVAGGNFGWNVKEGRHCFDAERPERVPANCPESMTDGAALIDPIIEYANVANRHGGGVGVVVVGGDVYRGSAIPRFDGQYIFGDFSRSVGKPDGVLLIARPRPNDRWKVRELSIAGRERGRLNHYLLGFGTDAAGEMYVLGKNALGPTGDTGVVYRISAR
jgi:glucose/arabinose dehydrogenase